MILEKLKSIKPIYLSIFSGLLLSLAWPPLPTSFLLLVAWVPMWIAASVLLEKKVNLWRSWLQLYPGILTWNILTTWWVYKASLWGSITMVILNSLMMSLVWLAYLYAQKTTYGRAGKIALIIFWIAFEYFHFNWDAAYPWLTLGNGFAGSPALVQWYEITGVLGGTLWILLANGLILSYLEHLTRKYLIFVLVVLTLPMGWSFFRFYTYQETGEEVFTVCLQPNVDPYSEKFYINPEKQAAMMKEMAETALTQETDLLVLPETALPRSFDERYVDNQTKLLILDRLRDSFPNLSILTGVESYEVYYALEKPTVTARKHPDEDDVFYDYYNTAVFIPSKGKFGIYHKSKLVPGVEKMPFPKTMGVLENLVIDLEGTTGSLGTSPEPVNFSLSREKATLAPLICYESIFGEYVNEFVKDGANILTIITNDGWWGNTPGYKQHLLYGALRCIETRRSMARSANTGISAIIDQKGVIQKKSDWWVKQTLSGTIRTNEKITFYVRWGDYIGKVSSFLAFFLFLSVIVKNFLPKNVLRK